MGFWTSSWDVQVVHRRLSFTLPVVILRGAKNLSGIRVGTEPREILRFAQNDSLGR